MNTKQLNKNRIINRILSELNIMISDLDKCKDENPSNEIYIEAAKQNIKDAMQNLDKTEY